MTATKPTILFVPGAWHTPECFDTVRSLLSLQGYPTDAVSNPSIGINPLPPPGTSLYDDAANLRATILRLVASGKDVILVLHSYGGCVGSCALEGLPISGPGTKGGVLAVLFLAALVLPKGKSMIDMYGGQRPSWQLMEPHHAFPINAGPVFYGDLPPDVQQKWVDKLQWWSLETNKGKITFEPWKHGFNCFYVLCKQDRALTVDLQEGFSAEIGKGRTWHIDASHSPFLSKPEKVVEVIEAAAKGEMPGVSANL